MDAFKIDPDLKSSDCVLSYKSLILTHQIYHKTSEKWGKWPTKCPEAHGDVSKLLVAGPEPKDIH